ncbi:MAG: hypothetical protein ACI81T_004253 [Bacteroidia bacterium]|jgi:hypothetical protein
MENNAELDGKYLGTISQDFAVVSNTLREAAHQLSFRKISEFPIFPISKSELPIGQLLIGRKEMALQWNYHFSFLEEFVQRNLIAEEAVDEFKKSFKKTDEFCCLFVVDGDFVNFVFIPYPED